jgi:DNA-binding MarR family transcriptional regulator
MKAPALSRELAIAAKVARTVLDRRLRNVGASVAIIRVLENLDGSPSVTMLASRIGVTPATVSALVKKLEAAGIVSRTANGNCCGVLLTSDGAVLREHARSIDEHFEDEILELFAPEDYRVVSVVLGRIEDAFSSLSIRQDALSRREKQSPEVD